MARVINATIGTSAQTFQQAREALVAGSYDPGATTTGVSPNFQSIKTSVSSAAAMPGGGFTPGATYSNYEFNFVVIPPVSNTTITFRNCWFRGPPTYPFASPTGLMQLFGGGHAPVELYDCTVRAQNPLPQMNGLHGYRMLVRRCDISYVSDGLSTFPGGGVDPAGPVDVDVQQSWIHDLVWVSQAGCAALGISTPVDGMHNDVIQHQGGEGLILKYNRMDATTAPEFFNDFYDSTGNANGNITYQNVVGLKDGNGNTIFGTGSVQHADIRFNLLTAGRSQVNMTTGNAGNLNDVGIYQNNRHQPDYSVFCINRPSGTISPFTCDFGSAGPPDTRNRLTTGGLAPQSNSGQ